MKNLKLSFHVLMLTLMLFAESTRFYNFFLLLSGSDSSALIFSVSVSLTIVYLAISELKYSSLLSVFICIGLSVISYIEPFNKEIIQNDSNKVTSIENRLKSYPVWKSSWESKEDKEARKKVFDLEVEQVKEHNERVNKELNSVETVGKAKLFSFIFSAFIMSICVPILTYSISHELVREVSGTIKEVTKKQNIDEIYKKLGGNKL